MPPGVQWMTSISIQTSTKLLLEAAGWGHEQCFHLGPSCQHLVFEGSSSLLPLSNLRCSQILNLIVTVAPGPSAFCPAPKLLTLCRGEAMLGAMAHAPSPCMGLWVSKSPFCTQHLWLHLQPSPDASRGWPWSVSTVDSLPAYQTHPDCSESQDTNECEIGTLAPHGILRWFSNRSSSRVQVKQHLPSGLEHTAFSSVSWLPEGWSWTQGICISGELVGNAESQAPA